MFQIPALLRFFPRSAQIAAISTLVALTSFLLLTSGTANAKRKKPPKGATPACGIDYLPFAEGTVWKYQYSIPPAKPGAAEKPGVIQTRIPEFLTITVKRVVANRGGTAITLEETYRTLVAEAVAEDKEAGIAATPEKYQDTAHTTQLSCSANELIVPPNSFFFVGELPGGLGMSIENIKRKGQMYPGKSGLKKDAVYFVEIKAEIERQAIDVSVNHLKAILQIERQIVVGKKEPVEVEYGEYKAIAVEFELLSQVALEVSPTKEVFSNSKAVLWFVPGVGVIRSYNGLDQGWDLASFTPATPAP